MTESESSRDTARIGALRVALSKSKVLRSAQSNLLCMYRIPGLNRFLDETQIYAYIHKHTKTSIAYVMGI